MAWSFSPLHSCSVGGELRPIQELVYNTTLNWINRLQESIPRCWHIFQFVTSPPIGYLAPHRGRARYCNAHVCLCVCVCVCPCFRKISKCNISVISQPIIMKLNIHIEYGYSVTDKYFQNFRSKVKVVGHRNVFP